MRTLNLGILAHVDAGKTTLSEQLLYNAGAIDHVGRVDAGTTQTDTLDLERERGITIRSAVASFLVGDLAVNLVDTPGHPDFIAEVERVLGVLDGAVLVVSAVEGVQPQTPLLFRALQRLRVPTLIFVNKIDRAGADDRRVLEAMTRRLSSALVPMVRVRDAGRRAASVIPCAADDPQHVSQLAEALAERDDAILRAYVDDAALSYRRLRTQLAAQTRRGAIHPGVLRFGRPRRGRRRTCWPASPSFSPERVATPTRPSPAAYSRSNGRPRVSASRTCACLPAPSERASACGSVARKQRRPRSACSPRRVRREAASSGPARWPRSGVSAWSGSGTRSATRRRATTWRAVSRARRSKPWSSARRPEESGRLRAALAQLADQDPLIDVRQDDEQHEISVSLYGEVQKEVIGATLERDYGIAADFRDTTTVCIERPAHVGAAEEIIRAKTKTNITGRSSPLSTNPFQATLALRIEPAPSGSGIVFGTDVEIRLVPLYLFHTLETFTAQMASYVREALAEGLAGWQVTDCRVTMTDCGYHAPISTAADFRRLTQLVLATALARAGTWVCEPLSDVTLEVPSPTAPGVVAALGRLGGRVRGQFSAMGLSTVAAVLPAALVRQMQAQLPGLSMGEGILETRFGGYQPIGSDPPRRPRSTPSPLDRDAWLAWLAKRG